MRTKRAEVFIGTSGFFYRHWRGIFYPSFLSQKDWFGYYTKHFDTVELNVSFYRLPSRETFEKWRKRGGENFVFSVKGSRLITHIKRLKDCQKPLASFLEAIRGLKTKKRSRCSSFVAKDVVLWQLPPRFCASPINWKRLKKFVNLLPGEFRYAFEFREKSWFTKESLERWRKLKKREGLGLVFQDYQPWFVCDGNEGRPTIDKVLKATNTSFVYLRFHGRRKLYSSCYTRKELREWAHQIRGWLRQGLDVYAYFNNDALGYAVENAKELRDLAGFCKV